MKIAIVFFALCLACVHQAWSEEDAGGDVGAQVDNYCDCECDGVFSYCMYCVCIALECFSGNNLVETRHGQKFVKDLRVNDEVLTVDSDGVPKYEAVMFDVHHNPNILAKFYRISMDDAKDVTLSPKHYLYVTRDNSLFSSDLVTADQIAIGDKLIVSSDGAAAVTVTDIEVINERGIYNPVVASGRLYVNGVLASNYVGDIPPLGPREAHLALWIVRQGHTVLPTTAHPVSGIPYWAHLVNLVRRSIW